MCGYCFVANYFKESDELYHTSHDLQNKDLSEADGFDFEIEEVAIETPGSNASFKLPQSYQEKFIVPENFEVAEHVGLRELFVAKFIESKFCQTNNSEEAHNFTSNNIIINCVRKSCEVQKRTLLSHLKTSKTLPTIFSDFYFLYDEGYYGDKRVNTYLDPKKAIDALRYYYAWWHKGFGIRRVSAEEVDNVQTGVVFDPLNTRDKNASNLFLVLFRCFFYSLQKVSTFPVKSRSYTYAKNILRKIITSSPFMLPDFGALDLWLLRLAVKIYAQNYGDISREMIGRMRPIFVYYLCKHCSLDTARSNTYFELFKSFHNDIDLNSIDDVIWLDH
jgi:hypothetical protein